MYWTKHLTQRWRSWCRRGCSERVCLHASVVDPGICTYHVRAPLRQWSATRMFYFVYVRRICTCPVSLYPCAGGRSCQRFLPRALGRRKVNHMARPTSGFPSRPHTSLSDFAPTSTSSLPPPQLPLHQPSLSAISLSHSRCGSSLAPCRQKET